MVKNSFEDSLNTQHESIIDAYNDEYPEGPPMGDYRITRIEEFYVNGGGRNIEWSPISPELRFYKTKKGKRAGKYNAYYYNSETHKKIRAPVYEYIKKLKEDLLSNEKLLNFGVNNTTEAEHLREHTIYRVLQRQKDTIKTLKKQREEQS